MRYLQIFIFVRCRILCMQKNNEYTFLFKEYNFRDLYRQKHHKLYKNKENLKNLLTKTHSGDKIMYQNN